MQLYFIRHGQSQNNQIWSESGNRKGRSSDPGLTELGLRQAQALADFIHAAQAVKPASSFDEVNGKSVELTHLYSSLMQRAILTGNVVAAKLEMPLYGLEDAYEGGGVYLEDEESGELVGQPGKTKAELMALTERLVLPDVNPDGWWNRPFESREERVARAKRLLGLLLDRHGGTDDKIAVFSHAAFFNYFMAAAVGLEQRPALWFYLNNTGISRFDFNGEDQALIYTNRTEHLVPQYLT